MHSLSSTTPLYPSPSLIPKPLPPSQRQLQEAVTSHITSVHSSNFIQQGTTLSLPGGKEQHGGQCLHPSLMPGSRRTFPFHSIGVMQSEAMLVWQQLVLPSLPSTSAHSRRRPVQSSKTSNIKPIVVRLIPPFVKHPPGSGAHSQAGHSSPSPCTTAPLRQKTRCSGQQVKNNLDTRIPWERIQGQEARGGNCAPRAPEW